MEIPTEAETTLDKEKIITLGGKNIYYVSNRFLGLLTAITRSLESAGSIFYIFS